MSYAISLDLDTEQLKQVYPSPSWQNAYGDIKKILVPLGFDWQQGSVYFGADVNAVQCVLAAQKLSQSYPWFKPCVRDIRMLRIEELNDLSPGPVSNTPEKGTRPARSPVRRAFFFRDTFWLAFAGYSVIVILDWIDNILPVQMLRCPPESLPPVIFPAKNRAAVHSKEF